MKNALPKLPKQPGIFLKNDNNNSFSRWAKNFFSKKNDVFPKNELKIIFQKSADCKLTLLKNKAPKIRSSPKD